VQLFLAQARLEPAAEGQPMIPNTTPPAPDRFLAAARAERRRERYAAALAKYDAACAAARAKYAATLDAAQVEYFADCRPKRKAASTPSSQSEPK